MWHQLRFNIQAHPHFWNQNLQTMWHAVVTRVSVQCTLWVQHLTPKSGCSEDRCTQDRDLHKAVLQGSVLFLLSSAVWVKRSSHCACRFTFVWHLPQQMLLNVTTTEFQIPLWESGTYKLAQMPKRCIVLSLPPLRANALCLLAIKIGLHQA